MHTKSRNLLRSSVFLHKGTAYIQISAQYETFTAENCEVKIFKIPTEKKMDHFRKIANEIHAQNKLFRLWNIPENEPVWTLLLKNEKSH